MDDLVSRAVEGQTARAIPRAPFGWRHFPGPVSQPGAITVMRSAGTPDPVKVIEKLMPRPGPLLHSPETVLPAIWPSNSEGATSCPSTRVVSIVTVAP